MDVQVRAVAAINSAGDGGDQLFIEPDVYPGTLALVPGGLRQLKVQVLNPNTGELTDIRASNQTVFAGTPESIVEYLDPDTQEPLLDPITGDLLFDPDTGEIVLDPNTGETVQFVTPAMPPVYSGTRYIVSDESIATVSESGLITAIADGEVTISIVHLASVVDEFGTISQQVVGQSDIRLTVQTAQVTDNDDNTPAPRAIAVSKDLGGVVSNETGETVMIGAGALNADIAISINRINITDIEGVAGMPIPGPGVLEAVGAFRLDIGDAATNHPLQLAIPVQGSISVQAGDEVLFFRKGKVLDPDGTFKDTWWLVDNGFVGADGVAHGQPAHLTADWTVPVNTWSASEFPASLAACSISALVQVTGRRSAAWASLLAAACSGSASNRKSSASWRLWRAVWEAAVITSVFLQFADIPMSSIPVGERYRLDLSKELPAVSTPWGNIVLPNLGSATVDAGSGALTLTQSNAAPSQFQGNIVVRALFDDGSQRDIKTIVGGGNDPIVIAADDLKTADGAYFAVGSVRWQLVRSISTQMVTSSGTMSGGDPLEFAGTSLRIVPKTDMAAVLTRTGITFIRENLPVGQTSLVGLLDDSNHFDGTYLTGTKVQPVVFTDDLSRAYVGGNGVVYVIDLVTFKLISMISIPAGKNITSLATAGSLLFIGEGNGYGSGASNSRLLAMELNPGSKDYHKTVTLKGTGIESSPLGVSGMTMGPDGKTLVVATPINPNSVGLGNPSKRGDVLVFDISTLDFKTGKIDAPIKAQLPGDGLSGKSPQVISATNDPDRFLVANVADYNRGLSTLVITRDGNKKLVSAKMTAIKMSQPSDAIRIDRLDIQRAQSAVFVSMPDGSEYAIVSDDNYHFLDPYWKAMYEAPDFLYTPFGPPIAFGSSASAKKVAVGGKLGIVKDPFGKNGEPQFIGATLPLDGYGIINLSLSDDGKVLIGQLKGGYGANLMDSFQQKPQQSHAWNVVSLIQAALAMPEQDRMSKHIKLPPDAEQLIANNAPPPAGTSFDDEIVLPKFDGRPGDINAIDVKTLINKQLEALGIIGATIENFRVQEDLQTVFDDKESVVQAPRTDGYVAGTKEGKIQLLTLKDGNTRKVLSRNDVDGAGDDNVTFSTSGILFAYRNITDDEVHQRLQPGKMLSEQSRVFNVLFDLTKADGTKAKGSKAMLTITVADAPTSATVFFGDRALDNPGYSAMKLQGAVDEGITDKLDIYKVEQRLKYLGFSKTSTTASNEVTVDGAFTAKETAALTLFEKVARYQSVTATGTGTSGSGAGAVTVEIQFRATVTATPDNVKVEEVAG
ncbi:Ig-like domain-containing protein [Polaromonas sp. P2-4]|nr:Ig-like domain-containing protein [Polaromonas sp. P2-4]